MVEQNNPTGDESTAEVLRDRWDEFDPETRKRLFFSLSYTDATDLFLNFNTDKQAELLEELPVNSRRSWVRLLAPDDAADYIQRLDEADREITIELLDPLSREEVKALLHYSEDVAGGLMNPRFARLRPEMSVEEAIRYLRAQAIRSAEPVHYAYVVDLNHKLIGVISFREILVASPDKKIQDVMKTQIVSVYENTDQEDVSHIFTQNKFHALPVLDLEDRIKGIVTYDDIASVAVEEATEDIQKLGGMEALDLPYWQTDFLEMVRKRGGWLVILFIGEMFTATAMGHYQGEIEKAVVLAAFIPLIISSGGNSGSQASTLIIRSLALKEIRLKDWWRVMVREISVGAVLGFILGIIGFCRIMIWPNREKLYGPHYAMVAITVSCSLVGIVLWGTISGSMLPFILRRLKLDPASASAPFVATIVDVTGLIIYFTVASIILSGTLL
jgi:magnesium transporter